MAKGPLAGVKVLEFAGLGPAPLAGMFLSDLGADVVEVAREGTPPPPSTRPDARGRRRVALNLKTPEAVATCLDLAAQADVVIEGNRPGVMERLGLGPSTMLARNPRLVYGRMTGWGQSGPYAHTAGHDINYLSLTGVLHAIGTAERPVPPLNLAADYGGGTMFLIMGILSAVLHARTTGEGQVIDVAMTDCAAYLASLFYGMHATGMWKEEREANLLDGGAHFYGVFECADGKWISIGSIEPQFYALLLEKTGTAEKIVHPQMDRAAWPEMREVLREAIRGKTRDEWCAIMEGTDVCFAPVLTFAEAPHHAHNVARGTFVESGGTTVPAPAPRFSATPAAIQWPPSDALHSTAEVLESWR
ncbi:CoA transferase [Novosphingobium sp. KCTC 2891]|uniref:CaiB/BaiF CoA transferase family protein n=1 Tax=Novosphingobium sp. KCTC 2891 TaxID=2989730 RepID=UPI0022213431|nr:CaiB/BaiF CoA-transferase family protein [Novosphingobium sp. KCTC 2891]MCW1384873.1 CoA transferase [Novosphingobium sp. KCTC 2891]